MAEKVIVTKSKLVALADTIRELTSDTGKMTLEQMAGKLSSFREALTARLATFYSTDTVAKIIDRTIESLTLPEGLTQIGDSAFAGCENLVLTEIPDSVTFISQYAFDQCTGVALTSLPANLQRVADGAFDGCAGNCFSVIPASVTAIGGETFNGNTGITSLTFKGTPVFIAANAFSGCTNVTDVYVPWAQGAVRGAPWGMTKATIHYSSAV